MRPRCEEIEIKLVDYTKGNIVICCNLPCNYSFVNGEPTEVPCGWWVDNECKKAKGIEYYVLLNGCAMIWESHDEETAKALHTVLKDVSERNEIKFTSCFKEE